MASNITNTSEDKRFFAGIALVILSGMLLYVKSLGYDFVWDDKLLIVNNHWVTASDSIWQTLIHGTHLNTYWRPLTMLSFYLNYQVAGLAPWVFHATQLLLHAFVIFLIIVWAWLLTENRRIALLAGLLFALHPMVSETVCFISARCNQFATIGFLGALIGSHLIYAGRIQKGVVVYILAAFVGIWAKESGVLLLLIPAMYWLYGALSKQSFSSVKHLWKPYAGVTFAGIAIAVLYVVVRVTLISNIDTSSVLKTGDNLLVNIVYRLPYWIGQILLPVFSKSDYYFFNKQQLAYQQILISAVSTIFIIAGIVLLWRKKQWSWLLNILLFLMVISPFLGFVSTKGRAFSESWIYMALPFFTLPLAALLYHAFYTYGWRKLTVVLLVGLVAGYGALSLSHMEKWRTQRTLFVTALEADPDNPKNLLGYGNLLSEEGDTEGAKKVYWHIIEHMPEFEKNYDLLSLLYLQEKDFENAEKVARLGLKNAAIKDRIYGVLATVLMQSNRFEEALEVLLKAPDSLKFAEKKRLLAAVLLQLGRTQEALDTLEQYVQQYPADTGAKKFYQALRKKQGSSK